MSSGVITLNVGGFLYTTTRSTLERAPVIDALLRNQGSLADCSFEGNPFIDRDGEAFKDILAFLRSGFPVVAHVPVPILEQEADFYCIKDFRVISAPKKPKKLFLPESTKDQDTIRGYFHDVTRRGQKRYRFDVDTLPANVSSHQGSGGVSGCVDEKDLAISGFRLEPAPPVAKTDSGEQVDEFTRIQAQMAEELVFKRTQITHYVDLQEFLVPDDGSTWDVVKSQSVNGQEFAVVTKYQ